MADRTVSSNHMELLKKHRLFEAAPDSRQHLGEKWLLFYKFTDIRYQYPDTKGYVGSFGARKTRVKCSGYLVFGMNYNLVAIDERCPYEIEFSRLSSKDGTWWRKKHSLD